MSSLPPLPQSSAPGLLFNWAQSTMEITLALGTSVEASRTITADTTELTEWTLSVHVSW